MKKAKRSVAKRASAGNGLRREYDFRGGVRGKYATRYATGANIVVVADDLAEEFPTAREVNRALREVLRQRVKRRTA